MKKSIFITIICAWLLNLSSCHEPEELIPSVSRNGINSVTASFENETGAFQGFSTGSSTEIIIPIPYYYPESSDNVITEADITRMRVRANLDDNVTISPAILYMDLTKNNLIHVTDQRKVTKAYTVRGEIRRSTACLIEEFSLPDLGLSGVINEKTKTISLVTAANLPSTLANIRLSYHATISPDPRTQTLDYNNEPELTVTADDGVTQSVYTIKKQMPPKLPYGIRSGSAKLLFAKKLNNDLGITTINLTSGIAAIGNYVVINTQGENSVYINAKTGEKIGMVDLGATKGNFINFYNTADDSGNILICNLVPQDGNTFKIWKLNSVTASPELLLSWNSGTLALGHKLSIQGSIDGNAIITVPFNNVGSQFARWTVVNGVLTSQTPDVITISGLTILNNNIDVVYTSNTDVTSDYYVVGYSDNRLSRISGSTNTVLSRLDQISTNYVSSAVDYIVFNKAGYVSYNHANSFSWGASDQVWVINTEAGFSGQPDMVVPNNKTTGTCPGAIFGIEKNTYGPNAIGAPVNANYTGDVAFSMSEDGYYLYFYFMFTNGYIVGYQFDCIEM